MQTTYPAIVLGTGGVGSAVLFHLAQRGVRALGIDRFTPGHDRGSSHGSTRIIRQAYFEHADYVPLALRAYELWADLEQRSGEPLLHQVGLLQVGPPQGVVIQGVLRSAQQHHLPLERLSAAEIVARWPGFAVPPDYVGLFEQRAGYLRVEACVRAHAQQAVSLGAQLLIGEAVLGWHAMGPRFVIQTDRQRLVCERLVITAGAWANDLLASLKLRLEVRRKAQLWYATRDDTYRAETGCPAYLFDTPQGTFYGFPQIDGRGVKVAQHSGGDVVADPLGVDRQLQAADRAPVEAFLARHLPRVSPLLADHSICMYTMSADEHFIVDLHPEHPRAALAAGLSGHGFKFSSVLGEALADLALDGKTRWPLQFLSCRRGSLSPR